MFVPLTRPPPPSSFPLPPSVPGSPTDPPETTISASLDPPSGSGLTPPASPRQSYNSTRTSSSSFDFRLASDTSPASSQLSHILVLSPSSIFAVTPTPPLTLALQALSSNASALSDALAPLLLSASVQEDGAQDEEAVKFVHQKVFLRGLKEARFNDEQGEIWSFAGGDVRLLVRLFPELRGVLEIDRDETGAAADVPVVVEIEVEEGLREEWDGFWDIEDISQSTLLCSRPTLDQRTDVGLPSSVQENLRRNYAPHIEPDVETSPSTTELRNVLLGQAREMLKNILVKERDQRNRRPKGKKAIRTRDQEVLDRVRRVSHLSGSCVSARD